MFGKTRYLEYKIAGKGVKGLSKSKKGDIINLTRTEYPWGFIPQQVPRQVYYLGKKEVFLHNARGETIQLADGIEGRVLDLKKSRIYFSEARLGDKPYEYRFDERGFLCYAGIIAIDDQPGCKYLKNAQKQKKSTP